MVLRVLQSKRATGPHPWRASGSLKPRVYHETPDLRSLQNLQQPKFSHLESSKWSSKTENSMDGCESVCSASMMRQRTKASKGIFNERWDASLAAPAMPTPGSFLMVSFLTVSFLLVKTSKLHNSALIPPQELSLRPKSPGEPSGRQL